jgi:hypothetical protein
VRILPDTLPFPAPHPATTEPAIRRPHRQNNRQ